MYTNQGVCLMGLKRRKDTIFGLHFDFHATENSPAIGENFTADMVQEIIDLVKPEFIQCDCKGHPGVSSYPTKVGNAAPEIKKDILKIWRDVTAKNNIPLFTHYSGLWDGMATKNNPRWHIVENFGIEEYKMAINLFCDYPEKLMIPQLCELAEEYNVDGVWIDGDCWGVLRDRSNEMQKTFFERTGLKKLPENRGDEGFDEYLDLLRELYRNYLNNYTKSVHCKYPDFQIASNWAYTTYMPEKVEADVDFLSGDVFGNDEINHARYEAKYLAQQNKPWDLMVWGDARVVAKPNDPTGGGGQYNAFKTSVQLKQEASQILAHGGGFQVYYMQNKDGSVEIPRLKQAAELADFCKSRKPYCFRGKQKSEIAVYYCADTAYKMASEAFGFMDGTLNFLKGDVALMSSLGLPVDFISEHHIEKDINRYSLIVVPEWASVFNKAELLAFAERGGNLLILGSKATTDFANELGVTVKEIKTDKRIRIYNNDISGNVGVPTNIAVVDVNDAEIVNRLDLFVDTESVKAVAATVKNYGKGKIAGVYFDTGILYREYKDIILSDLIKSVTDILIPKKRAEVNGSRYVDIALSEIDGNLCVGLLNTAGPHADPNVLVYDEIPTVSGLTVRVKCEKLNAIFREPQHINMPFNYENGVAEIKVDGLEIYDILVIK